MSSPYDPYMTCAPFPHLRIISDYAEKPWVGGYLSGEGISPQNPQNEQRRSQPPQPSGHPSPAPAALGFIESTWRFKVTEP